MRGKMFEDLPEGQTHSYNDGCGEPAHNCCAYCLRTETRGVENKKVEFCANLNCHFCHMKQAMPTPKDEEDRSVCLRYRNLGWDRKNYL